jgi:hypothetical protein
MTQPSNWPAPWEEMMVESDYFAGPGPLLFSPDGRSLAKQGGISASGEAPWILWRAPTLAEIDHVEETNTKRIPTEN